jgi:streptogramin lyase
MKKLCPSLVGKTVYLALFFMLTSCLLMSGCFKDTTCHYISPKPIFFPPAPDDPHIQYLTGINSTDDIGAGKTKSTFTLVVTGQEKADIVKKLTKSYGITAYKGKLYVAEGMSARVSIIDPVAGTIDYPPGLESSKGGLKYPVGVAVDDEGYLYVADSARRQIVAYDPSGNFFKSYGSNVPGSKFVGVGVYKGKIFALDLGTNRIRVLDRTTGEQLQEMGYIEKPDQSLRYPASMFIDGAGNIYVTNAGSGLVIKYDQDGNYLGSFGGMGDQLTQFAKPKGITVDDAGRVYVVDGGTNVVQLYDDQFRLLTFFGWPGLPYGSLNGPSGIVTSKDNIEYFQKFAAPGFKIESLVYVLSQFGQEFCIPRISVYAIGEMKK